MNSITCSSKGILPIHGWDPKTASVCDIFFVAYHHSTSYDRKNMGLKDTIEVWLILLGVVVLLTGIAGGLVNKMAPDKVPLIKKLYKWFIGIGLVLVLVALGIALFMGRLIPFFVSLTSPWELISQALLQGAPAYSQSCVNDKCTKYCCQDKIYPELKWKDCSSACNGWEGHFGDMTGDNCLGDMSRDAYCKAKVSTAYKSSACNSNIANGPITCACCSGRDITGFDSYWWDCNTSCSSNGIHGTQVSPNACSEDNKLYCIKSEVDSDLVNTNNNQSF